MESGAVCNCCNKPLHHNTQGFTRLSCKHEFHVWCFYQVLLKQQSVCPACNPQFHTFSDRNWVKLAENTEDVPSSADSESLVSARFHPLNFGDDARLTALLYRRVLALDVIHNEKLGQPQDDIGVLRAADWGKLVTALVRISLKFVPHCFYVKTGTRATVAPWCAECVEQGRPQESVVKRSSGPDACAEESRDGRGHVVLLRLDGGGTHAGSAHEQDHSRVLALARLPTGGSGCTVANNVAPVAPDAAQLPNVATICVEHLRLDVGTKFFP